VSAGWQWPPGWRAIRRQVFRVKGRQCYWCGGPATTVDHWPVPAALGGPHTLDNLIPSCARDNYSRGASFGNRLRGPLPAAQRRAIAAKARDQEAEAWRSARRW
jgi:5-methylcytosine-specific restriction endonuclease McrA